MEKMNFEQFQKTVIDEMRDRFPDLEIEAQKVNKLQGQSYSGMSVRPEGSNIAATLNLQTFFDRVEDGSMSVDRAVDSIARTVEEVSGNMPRFDVKELTDYEQMKDKLTMQLIPVTGNEVRLNEIPHQVVEDMALVYRFEMDSNEQGSSSILVTNSMLQTYGVEPTQLHADALEAAAENHPASLRNMNDVLHNMMGDMGGLVPDEPSPMWVATVKGGMNGASVIQYPDFLDQAAETLGGDFFVLPSSVHEVLLIPDDGSMDAGDLEHMVREINATEVAPEDRLSDNVFHYDSEAHIFENAHTFEARQAERDEAMLADQPFSAEMSRSDTITVLLVEPNEHPKVVEVGTELSDLQAAVGGDIEVVYPFEENVGLIMNEEGKINGLPLNRALRDENGEVYDVVAGSFLVTGLTEDSFASLPQEQIGKFEEKFHQPEAFVKMGRSITAIPIPEETLQVREAAKAKDPEEIGAKPKHKKQEHDGH